jgi:hypothetical protein
MGRRVPFAIILPQEKGGLKWIIFLRSNPPGVKNGPQIVFYIKSHRMKEEPYVLEFSYPPENLEGTVTITPQYDGEEIFYLVDDVVLNSDPENPATALLIPQELLLKGELEEGAEDLQWVDAETGEETEFGNLIGSLIEKRQIEVQ